MAEKVEHVIAGLTVIEFLEWLDKREIFMEGPGRVMSGKYCIRLRDMRDQSVYEGLGSDFHEALMLGLGYLFDERNGS